MTELTITRFDIFDRPANEQDDERTVVRLFAKRKLLGEIDVNDVTRYGEGEEFDSEDFTAWIFEQTRKGHAPILTAAMDYLGEEPREEGDEDEDAEDGGSIVPLKYRILYGSPQNCGDAMALALTGYVTLGRVTKKNEDGGLDRVRLAEVAAANGLAGKLADWEARGLNGGLLRMNLSNVLRGMLRRGEEVVVHTDKWPANPKLAEERKAKRRKAAAPKAK